MVSLTGILMATAMVSVMVRMKGVGLNQKVFVLLMVSEKC